MLVLVTVVLEFSFVGQLSFEMAKVGYTGSISCSVIGSRVYYGLAEPFV